jgi:pimeloyl-ACP methyl ester carboxylesterase
MGEGRQLAAALTMRRGPDLRAVTSGARSRRVIPVAIVVGLIVLAGAADAAPCANEDFIQHVSGDAQCLLMRRFGPVEAKTLVVWIHGDVSSGGPADYHFALADRAARALEAEGVVSVALVRPGYPDGSGESSGVALLESGRADHYTRANVGEVGAALARLRAHERPARLVVVGHSGGAATAAILLGLRPGLIDAAVLVSCPCDLVAWRDGHRAWSRSENPIAWADRVEPPVRVVALTGERDDNTGPDLARRYVAKLQARGVDARFERVAGETHNGAFRSPAVLEAVRGLLGVAAR